MRAAASAERLAPPGTHFDLGRDQLSDEMLLERRPLRRGVHVLEAVRQLERLGIEDRELLLHRDGEVGAALVGVVGGANLLVRSEALLVAHAGSR